MIFEREFIAFLASRTGVVNERWYPLVVPKNAAWPCGRFELVRTEFDYGIEGQLDNLKAFYRLEIWEKGSGKYLAIKTIADKLRKALSGYRGLMGTVLVESAFFQDESDQIAISEDADELMFVGVAFDVEIEYHEPQN